MTAYSDTTMRPSPQTSTASHRRRQILTVGVAALAAASGFAGYWWQSRSDSNANLATTSGLPDLWTQTFDTPDGNKIAMPSLRGKPLLINFWATWCPPCIDELPLLEHFYTQNKANGMQMLGLAADKTDAVQRFLQKMPLTFPMGLVGMAGIALSKSWGNTAGGLPFSVLLAANGQVLQRKMGKLSDAELMAWVANTAKK